MFADSGSHDEMVSVPGGDLLPEQGDAACEDRAAEWYQRSEEGFYGIVGWLAESDAAALEHGELESQLRARGRELLRCLLEDHLALRTVREERLDGVADAEGVEHRAVERDHERPLASVFGEVTVGRLACRAKGEANLYVADGLLNLPVEHASHGVRRLAALESAAGSFEHARDMVFEHTGLALGKRGVEGLTVRAAVDFDGFTLSGSAPSRTPGSAPGRSASGSATRCWSCPRTGRGS